MCTEAQWELLEQAMENGEALELGDIRPASYRPPADAKVLSEQHLRQRQE